MPVECLLHHQPHAMLCIAALLALPLVLGACYDDCEKSGSNLLQSHARRVEPKCLGLVIVFVDQKWWLLKMIRKWGGVDMIRGW